MLWLLIALLVSPLLLAYLRRRPQKEVYRGPAYALVQVKYIDPSESYAWIMLRVPNQPHIRAYISVERARSLPDSTNLVTVEAVIKRGSFGDPWVESIKWSEHDVPRRATANRDDGLFLLGFYVLTGLMSALIGFINAAMIFVGAGLVAMALCAILRKPIADDGGFCEHAEHKQQ